VPQLPDLSRLSHAEKDALILALWHRLEAAERRIAELEAKLDFDSCGGWRLLTH
jgi:transposase